MLCQFPPKNGTAAVAAKGKFYIPDGAVSWREFLLEYFRATMAIGDVRGREL